MAKRNALLESLSQKNVQTVEKNLNEFEEIVKSGKGTSDDVEIIALARGQLVTAKNQQGGMISLRTTSLIAVN